MATKGESTSNVGNERQPRICPYCGGDIVDWVLGQCDACVVFGPPCATCGRRGLDHVAGCTARTEE